MKQQNLHISKKCIIFAPKIEKYSHKHTTTMAKYICDVCGYEYDPSETGKAFEELPQDWTCPICGVGKDQFSKE